MSRHWETHDCYEKGDIGAPDVIKDQNGDIALSLCKHCGRGEAELDEMCDAAVGKHVDLIRLLKAIRPRFGIVGSRDVDVAAQRAKIDDAIRMLVKVPQGWQQLMTFYSVDTPEAMVTEMERHIVRLQAKVSNYQHQPVFTGRVREG